MARFGNKNATTDTSHNKIHRQPALSPVREVKWQESVVAVKKQFHSRAYSMRSAMKSTYTDVLRRATRTGSGTLRIVSLLLLIPFYGKGDIAATTQSLAVSISPAGKISVPASATLTASSTQFATFTGSILVSYWARTSDGGSGSVAVNATSEFSPSGGPAASAVLYTCNGASLGTGCSGIQTIQIGSQTPVVALPGGICTGGGGACSSQDPNTVELQFALPNTPRYQTGSYYLQLTFTISSL